MIVYRELSSLCADLKVSPKLLYSLSNSIHKHYHRVKIPKNNGGFRNLMIPDEKLLMVQRKINKDLLSGMQISNAASAYFPGRGIKRNASVHVGKSILVKLDIWHFFDNILYQEVKERVFPEFIYSEPLRVLLTNLCYGVNELPQGAATSPAISNIILFSFDEEMLFFCRTRNIAYTRYSDDMTFSGDFDASELIRFVSEKLKETGFLLNKKKIRVMKKGQKMQVTGITVNEKVNIPADYRRNLRQEIYYIDKFGIEGHMMRMRQKPQDHISLDEKMNYLRKILGKINYCLTICPDSEEMRKNKELITKILKRM